MGLSSRGQEKYTTTMITKCTCGRNMFQDKKELAVLAEQDGYTKMGNLSGTSLVVCMRDGCDGKWRTNRPYMQGLPRILTSMYLENHE